MPLSPELQRDYQRRWIAARRAEYLADKVCVRCGSGEELEVDHIDPALKVDHKVWSWRQERRDQELAKCQVLCHSCHLKKTADDRRPPHGTNGRYNHHKCRCTACRAAHAAKAAEYRRGLGIVSTESKAEVSSLDSGAEPDRSTSGI